MVYTEYESGRTFERRIGERVQVEGLEAVWVVARRGRWNSKKPPLEAPGSIEDLSLTGARVTGPADLAFERGDRVVLRFKGRDNGVVVRHSRPGSDPDECSYGVELVVVHPSLKREILRVVGQHRDATGLARRLRPPVAADRAPLSLGSTVRERLAAAPPAPPVTSAPPAASEVTAPEDAAPLAAAASAGPSGPARPETEMVVDEPSLDAAMELWPEPFPTVAADVAAEPEPELVESEFPEPELVVEPEPEPEPVLDVRAEPVVDLRPESPAPVMPAPNPPAPAPTGSEMVSPAAATADSPPEQVAEPTPPAPAPRSPGQVLLEELFELMGD